MIAASSQLRARQREQPGSASGRVAGYAMFNPTPTGDFARGWELFGMVNNLFNRPLRDRPASWGATSSTARQPHVRRDHRGERAVPVAGGADRRVDRRAMRSARGGRDPLDTRDPLGHLDGRLVAAVITSLAVHAAAMSVSFPVPRVLLSEALPVLEVSLRSSWCLPRFRRSPPVPHRPRRRRSAPSRTRRGRASPCAAPGRASCPRQRRPRKSRRNELRHPRRKRQSLRRRRRSNRSRCRIQCRARPRPSCSPATDWRSRRSLRASRSTRRAQMQGWEGSVTMQLRVAASGRLLEAEVHRSSGHGVLDREALAMVAKPRASRRRPRAWATATSKSWCRSSSVSSAEALASADVLGDPHPGGAVALHNSNPVGGASPAHSGDARAPGSTIRAHCCQGFPSGFPRICGRSPDGVRPGCGSRNEPVVAIE